MVVTGFFLHAIQDSLALADSAAASPPTSAPRWLLELEGLGGAILTSSARILLIFLVAWLLIRVISRAIREWNKRFEALPETNPRRQRAFTIGTLFGSTARYLIWPLALIMILGELELDVSALLATAGIAGIAIGFGAQTLVQDVISGVFLLFDDTIRVGDLVRIGPDVGTVEYIGVRLIKVRKFDGELLMVPAGELRTFANRSMGYVRVIVNVGVAYEQDLDAILPVMQEVADAWAEENTEIMMEERPQAQAIIEFGDSSVVARIVVMVVPGNQWASERDLRHRLKREFDRRHIEIPFPRRTLYLRKESDPEDENVLERLSNDKEKSHIQRDTDDQSDEKDKV